MPTFTLLFKKLKEILSWLLKNKKLIVLFFVSVSVFFVLLFPINDLSYWVSSNINKLTSGQIYLKFKKMSLSFSPTPGLRFNDSVISGKQIPEFKIDEMTITPNLLELITFKPGFRVDTKGFMQGQLSVSFKNIGKTANDNPKINLQVTGEQLSLKQMRETFSLPVELMGETSLNLNTNFDVGFETPPTSDIKFIINSFSLPNSSVSTPMGPLTLPLLSLSKVSLEGQLKENQFEITKGEIGSSKDDLYGSISGSMGVKINKRGRQVQPDFGSYNFNVDIVVKKKFSEKATLFLSFLNNYKYSDSKGVRYIFRVSSPSFRAPPQLNRAR